MLTLSNLANTERPYNKNIAHVVEEVTKDVDSRLFFALNGVLEKWEMCPWKFLKFFVKKRVTNRVFKDC